MEADSAEPFVQILKLFAAPELIHPERVKRERSAALLESSAESLFKEGSLLRPKQKDVGGVGQSSTQISA